MGTLVGAHDNDAFSALRIEHYKSFLRIKIDPVRHTLTVYVVGVDRVQQRWPALRGRGKRDTSTAHTDNPLWYFPTTTRTHLVEEFVLDKYAS